MTGMQKSALKFGVFDSDRTRVGLDNQSQNLFFNLRPNI